MSLYAQVKELRSKRAKMVKEAGDILQAAQKENRAMNAAEESRFNQAHADADALRTQIEQIERQMDAERAALRTGGEPPAQDTAPEGRTPPVSAERRRAIERASYRSWLRAQPIEGTPEEVEEIRAFMQRSRVALDPEMRALSAIQGTIPTAGGYSVPDSEMQEIDRAILQFSGMMEAAQVIETSSGSDLPWPTVNDTGNKGAQLNENAQAASNVDPTFGQVVLKAWIFTSKIILIPITLLQDSATNVEALVNEMVGERLGRILNEKATTGAGTTTFNGIVTAAAAGVTSQAPAALSYTQDLLPLKHSVDPGYRRGGRGRWMFNDTTLLACKKMTDGTGRLLWQPGVSVGEPDRLDGDPYIVNQDMADIAPGAVPVIYGDLSKYKIRRVRGITMIQMRERYADYLQVGIMAFTRADGNLVDAGTHPVKKLTMHA